MSRTVRVKNNTLSTGTWVGTEIAAGAYHTIDPTKELKWSESGKVLTDVGSGDLIVNDGTNDITDVNKAINYLKGKPGPTDTDGAPLARTKITQSGWHYQVHTVSWDSSKLDSVYNKDYLGNDLGFATIKYYDNTDTELVSPTQATLDTDCVRTDLLFEPTHDMEVIGGKLKQRTAPAEDVRMWIIAVPDVPKVMGGSVDFTQGGLNLYDLGDNATYDIDGKTAKMMSYDALYHTNKFQVILRHGAGFQCRVSMHFKLFKSGLV